MSEKTSLKSCKQLKILRREKLSEIREARKDITYNIKDIHETGCVLTGSYTWCSACTDYDYPTDGGTEWYDYLCPNFSCCYDKNCKFFQNHEKFCKGRCIIGDSNSPKKVRYLCPNFNHCENQECESFQNNYKYRQLCEEYNELDQKVRNFPWVIRFVSWLQMGR